MMLPILTILMTMNALFGSGKLSVLATSGNNDVSDIERLSSVMDAIDGLNKKVASQDRKIADQDSKIEEQGHKIADLMSENDRLKAIITSNTWSTAAVSRNERLLLMNQPQQSVHETKPAFTARLSQHLKGIGNQQAVIFDNVETNIGNHYSPISGVFTAPLNGTYYFFASILSLPGEFVETEMVLNGHSIAFMFCYGQYNDQGTNGVVVNLKQGDLVWVRHLGTNGNNVYGNHWSTFTGFMV